MHVGLGGAAVVTGCVDKFLGISRNRRESGLGSCCRGPAGSIKLGPPACPGWFVAESKATVKRISTSRSEAMVLEGTGWFDLSW